LYNETEQDLSHGQRIGDYVLETKLSSDGEQEAWSARQGSVNREVVLEFYSGPDPETFVEDMKVKASLTHRVWGLVYEGIEHEGRLGFTRERLPEESFATLAADGRTFKPRSLFHLLTQVSSSIIYLRERGIGYEPIAATDIRLGDMEVVRISNCAHAGGISAANDILTREALANALRELLKKGYPGGTRMMALCDLIDGQGDEPISEWQEIKDLAEQVEDQLTDRPVASKKITQDAPSPPTNLKWIRIGGAAAILIIAIIVAVQFGKPEQKPEVRVDTLVRIDSGKYPLPNGETGTLDSFWIDSHEVTIGEYALFLEEINDMSGEERRRLVIEGEPLSKSHYRPDDWRQIYRTAREHKEWRGQVLNLNFPVVGLDWWDAATYAKWKGGRLPTQEEWWAASEYADPVQKYHEWSEISGDESKPCGLSGNVAEWLLNPSTNPATPMAPKKSAVAGTSFKSEHSAAKTREWLDSKSIRRPDIGFRVVYSSEDHP